MYLSDQQVKDGFWVHRRDNNFPPTSITYPEEYDGKEHLNIVCTQLDISDYKQKKLTEKWAKNLPSLSNVRYLWFSSRVNQPLFEVSCLMVDL
jgi:hypothetical protein